MLLALRSLTAGYGSSVILHDVSLTVEAGQIVCLIGPNGAGKSTVLRALYGFARLLSGQILYDGADITGHPPADLLERGIAYVPQGSSIFPDMTVEENLLMGRYLRWRQGSPRTDLEALYTRFPRLTAFRSRPARTLSGGERRLLEIARSLLVSPRLLLLDEPSLGLEPRSLRGIFDTIRELNQAGASILLVEQNAKKALEIAHHGYVLAAGQIVYQGSGHELLAHREIGRLFLGG